MIHFKNSNAIQLLGFTLIELLIVIGLMGVLATIVLVVIDPAERIRQVDDSAALQRIETFAKAMEQYNTFMGKYYFAGCSGGVTGFNCASQALVDIGAMKNQIVSQENGYTLYYYSYDNMNSTSFDDGSFCGSTEKCVRFLVYTTGTSLKSKSMKEKYGNGTNGFLIYDSKYQKICGSATDPHLGRATNCDGT